MLVCSVQNLECGAEVDGDVSLAAGSCQKVSRPAWHACPSPASYFDAVTPPQGLLQVLLEHCMQPARCVSLAKIGSSCGTSHSETAHAAGIRGLQSKICHDWCHHIRYATKCFLPLCPYRCRCSWSCPFSATSLSNFRIECKSELVLFPEAPVTWMDCCLQAILTT